MKFQVPQFIETEIKLVGPFTLKQFIWIAAGATFLYLLFMLTKGGFIFYILALPIAGLAGAFAFLKIGDEPLINYAAYALGFVLSPKKYIFKEGNGKINK